MATSEAELRKSLQNYGNNQFTEKQQIKILRFMLEDTKSKLTPDNEIYKLITDYQSQLKDEKDLQEAIKIINQFIIDLEANDPNGVAINYLKKRGLYRMVYRNPLILGEELPKDDILHKLLRNGFIGIGASALIILLFVTTAFFAAPFWLTAIVTGLFVGACAYLSGILYGVINDIFATHANLPYFLLGHQPQQKSLLRTNDKIAQGVAWGIAATFVPVIIAAISFSIAATITALFVPMATFLLPAMIIAMPLIAVAAEFYARKKARQYEHVVQHTDFTWIGTNRYQQKGLNYMCPTPSERAAWFANSDRNLFGFTKVPLIGFGGLVGLIALSAISIFLPSLLIASPIIAIAIPAAFATIACVTLIAAGVYLYVNRNKQTDDRYRLEFDCTEIEPKLYLEDDMAYVDTLMDTYGNKQRAEIEERLIDDQNARSPLIKRTTPSTSASEPKPNEQMSFT